MAKSITAFNLAYFMIICTVSWILRNLPTCTVCSVYDSVGRTLLTCMIIYYTSPFAKRIFFSRRVSPRNKAVLITGCDTGFGHLLAKKLDSKGFQVFASCLSPDGDGARILKETCSASVHVFSLDVTKDADVKAAVDYVKKNLGESELWAVVNNAGILEGFEIEWTRIEKFQEVMNVNAMGLIRVTKAFLPLLRSSKGRVVTITSVAGTISGPSVCAYSMSKYAATCFCECLRQEMRPWGVKVIAIEPEGFRTLIVDWNTMKRRLDEAIRHLDEDIKDDYGSHYFEEYKKGIRRHTDLCSSRIYKVIDSLEEAVTFAEPCDVYRPRRNIFFRLFFVLMETLPRAIVDVVSHSVQYFNGFPQPKVAAHRF